MMKASNFGHLRQSARDGRASYALMLAFVVSFSIYKALSIGFGRAGELWLTCTFDASFWAVCWLLSELLADRRVLGRERAAGTFFYLLLYASGALVFAHTWFYDDASERRLTVLDISASGLRAFFNQLPVKGYVALAGLLLGLHALAFVLVNVVKRPRLSRALMAVSVLCLASGLSALPAPRTPPSALFDTAYGLWQFASVARVEATPVASRVQQRNLLDKSTPAALPTPRFTKVIVLVMETMTSERFARDLRGVPANSFFRSGEHVHSYTRYFPNNQDSRTGMLAMLTSRVIPYEAYNDADLAAYSNVVRTETLVDHMRGMGFRSAFALSQVVPEEIVCDLKWDEMLHLHEQEIPQLSKKHLCLVPDPWENSCEDVVLIPRIVDFLAKSERAFVYQEFIWGHAIEYNQLSGKSNGLFYSLYVDALIGALAERGILDDTLIAVTSDHGYRGQTVQNQLSQYRIPLWFYASRFSARSDARLLSHVDFRDLLFDELSETRDFSTANEQVFVQGPTGSSMSAAISERGALTLIKQRAGRHMLLAQRPERRGSELTPGQILYLFERHRERFDQSLRTAR
jgi:hypothetical protein